MTKYQTIWTTTTTTTSTMASPLIVTPPPRPRKKPPPLSFEVAMGLELRMEWWAIANYHDRSASACYEKERWVGLTVSSYSPRELKACREWVKQRGPNLAVCLRQESCDSEPRANQYIGEFETYCVCLWFATEELRQEFADYLDTFPLRNIILKTEKNRIGQIRKYLQGTNYSIIKGDRGVALGVTSEISEYDLVLLQLML